MIKLEKALRAWGTPGFESVLKQEVAQLGAEQLPLQQGLSNSSSVSDQPVAVVIINVAETEDAIRVKAGIIYQGVIGGCSCAGDPTPDSEINEYCEVQLDIDKFTAATRVELVAVTPE
ncbi:MAG: hypothetical protein WAW02_01470 [Sideroxyarcus sp.]